MTNIEIAKLLRRVAAVYTILGESRFKIIAYDNAATAVEHSTSELKDLWDDDQLNKVPGLGPSIISHVDELFKHGKVRHWEELFRKVPPALFPLLDIPGVGPKTAYKLVTQLKLKTEEKAIDDLKIAIGEHKISSIEGFGDRSEKELMENVRLYEKGLVKENRLAINQADAIADDLIKHLGTGMVLGSLRRRVATVGDIDIAAATENPQEIIAKFLEYKPIVEVIEQGPTGASVRLSNGRQVDLRVIPPKQWGSMLQYFTGSKYHNIKLREYALKKGLSLSEYGIKDVKSGKVAEFATEEAFYRRLDLDYIAPELREDTGEIEAALRQAQGEPNGLPDLIELKDVRGNLHMHSSFATDTSHDSGKNTVREMRATAAKLGYDYIGISDHNPSTKHTDRQMEGQLKRRREHFNKVNRENNSVRVINLLEVDIQPSGKLAVPDEALDFLDACLVSVHSDFNLPRLEMTKRVIAGLSHPRAKILAHPTGRMIGKREGYELDWDQIFDYCLKNDKAVEINAYPERLDLPDTLVREAVRRGVKLSLGTDAHIASDLAVMKYGIDVARRGWATKSDVINCLSYSDLMNWLKK